MVPEAGDGRLCQARRCSAIFSVLSCRSLRDLYFNLYDMNETRITMQKNVCVCTRVHVCTACVYAYACAYVYTSCASICVKCL